MKKTVSLVNNSHGFTLIEMMIVLMIISILLLIAVPNMKKNNDVALDKGCQATIDLLQAQVGAYQIEKNQTPLTLSILKEEGYVERIDCPNGDELRLNNGKVEKSN